MRQEKLSFLLRKLIIRFYGDARIMPLRFRISVLFPEALLWARLLEHERTHEREQFWRGSSFVYLNPENKLLHLKTIFRSPLTHMYTIPPTHSTTGCLLITSL